jgi:hypothetical protein
LADGERAASVLRVERNDLARSLVTGDPWRRPGQVVAALAAIDVGEVEAIAWVRTTATPGLGCGSGRAVHSRTSGPPKREKVSACMGGILPQGGWGGKPMRIERA